MFWKIYTSEQIKNEMRKVRGNRRSTSNNKRLFWRRVFAKWCSFHFVVFCLSFFSITSFVSSMWIFHYSLCFTEFVLLSLSTSELSLCSLKASSIHLLFEQYTNVSLFCIEVMKRNTYAKWAKVAFFKRKLINISTP